MAKLIECVPNFSEGRDEDLIKQIVCEIERIRDVILLDKEMDADHNRSVITFAGPPEAVKEAAFLATKKASELIDLNRHTGEHPRRSQSISTNRRRGGRIGEILRRCGQGSLRGCVKPSERMRRKTRTSVKRRFTQLPERWPSECECPS